MTNLPAVHEPTVPARMETDSWIPVLADVANLAEKVAGTEFVPKGLRGSPAAVAAAILYGREVGLPPMTALNQTHVIEGKPAISAEGMRAMVYAAGHDLVIVESTGAQCVVRARRRGSEEWTTIGWSLDMARAAGIAGKAVWRSYPRAMLQARATAEICRLVFPDVIHGFRAVEELDDAYDEGESAPPAGPTTRVGRTAKKAAAKKSTTPPLERAERPELVGPPLPGEAGYEPSAGEQPPAGTDEGASGSEAEAVVVASPAEAQATDTESTVHEPVSEEGPSEGEGEGEAPEPSEDPNPARGPRLSTRSQHRMIFALLKDVNGGENMPDEDRLDVAKAITHQPIESFNDLTHTSASQIIDTLGRVKSREELDVLLAELSRAEADRWNEGDRS